MHIRKCPYSAPLTQRKLVDEALTEVLEVEIIYRTKISCGFPVLLVEKTDSNT